MGKFQGYWGMLPRQSKVKYGCDPVSSNMPLTNTSAITAYEKTLLCIFIVSVIDFVFLWGSGGGGAICDSEIYAGGMS